MSTGGQSARPDDQRKPRKMCRRCAFASRADRFMYAETEIIG
jgi:hypothetical protein